jgi:hypothetical protein
MVVCGADFTADIIARIQEKVESEPTISRRALSRRVCTWLGWEDARGNPKVMSCRVALLRLHRRGVIGLPELAAGRPGGQKQRSEEVPITEPTLIDCCLEDLGHVDIVAVENGSCNASRTWNVLMSRYHYLGAGPLCGAQIRYLIRSPRYGWLGGLSFSAAAWRVGARDRWIEWDDPTRAKHLHKVVCNSRFLILPQVKVKNLASHVLSLCARRIPEDWFHRYGYRPALMETYVQRDRFKGTCYRAANWEHVGTTKGRGRQDRQRSHAVPIKDVYVYPLCGNVREELHSETMLSVVTRETLVTEGAQDWAEEEFGRAELGDQRLTNRLVDIARDFYARPQASVPQACQTRAKTKAAYRFFEHPATSMDRVLHRHYETTLARMSREKVVLAVQDTTGLNYSSHPATERLGPIGNRPGGLIGLLVHDTMSFTPDGTPLGLVDVQCWARDPGDFGKRVRRHDVPIEQKESNKWLRSFRKVVEAQKRCPGTTIVSVGDREADIYELFALGLYDSSGVGLLVRAMHDRPLAADHGYLWEDVGRHAVCGIQEVRVPRHGNRPARTARLEVRFAEIRLKPPKRKQELRDLTIWAVLAREADVPAGTEPLEWMLLTTCKVTTFDEAVEKLRWYTVRWGIEVYHRTLKSGCRIEERQLGHADRIETCLGIDMVVAWRIHHLTKLGRETPDVPCTVYFEDAEWKALASYITRNPVPPAHAPTLREATRMVATLGGFLGRKCDGEPGTESLWIGLQRLDDLTSMWKIMTDSYVPLPQIPPVSSNPRYG